jgi:Kef-type K+ transport system membrane component KefB
MIAVAVIGKVAAGWFVRESAHLRFVIGLAMVPRGEVGLVFAQLGLSSGVFGGEVYASVVLVIAITTLLPPFMLKAAYRRASAPT